MELADYIRKTRRSLEMSQHELAKELDVSYTSINRWEKKHVVPSKLARKSFIEFCKSKDIHIPPEIIVNGNNTEG